MNLPDYIDPDLFQEWIEWRKESSRKKLAEKSLQRIIKLGISKLEKLHGQGYDPNICIENTIFNEWRGFFPYDRSETNNRVFNGTSRADQARAEIERLFGEDESVEAGHAEVSQLRLVK